MLTHTGKERLFFDRYLGLFTRFETLGNRIDVGSTIEAPGLEHVLV